MNESVDKPLFDQIETDLLRERVSQLEEAILSLSADIQNQNIAFKDMQKIIIRIATNQQQLAERVKMWPYVKINHRPRKEAEDD